MKELAFTSETVLYLTAGTFLFTLLVIFLGRYYLDKTGHSNLKQKHAGETFASPLIGRTKYPELDVLKHSNQFFTLGLVLSLFLMVGLMAYTSYEETFELPDYVFEVEPDIEVEPPRSATPPPPPPPPPPPVIAEVPNETILDDMDDLEFVDQSIEAESMVEAPPVVEAPKAATEKAAPPPPPPPPPAPKEPEVEEIFVVVEQMPEFPGCEDVADKEERKSCAAQKMLAFVYKNIEYPNIAKENNVQGTVVVRFVVTETGAISQPSLLKDIGAGCGDEALRVINLMNEKHKWHPGKQRGKAVKVWFNLPVKFKLLT